MALTTKRQGIVWQLLQIRFVNLFHRRRGEGLFTITSEKWCVPASKCVPTDWTLSFCQLYACHGVLQQKAFVVGIIFYSFKKYNSVETRMGSTGNGGGRGSNDSLPLVSLSTNWQECGVVLLHQGLQFRVHLKQKEFSIKIFNKKVPEISADESCLSTKNGEATYPSDRRLLCRKFLPVSSY